MKALITFLLFAFIFFSTNVEAQPSKTNYNKRSWYKTTESNSQRTTLPSSDNTYSSIFLDYDVNDNRYFDVKDDWGYGSKSSVPISDYIPILMVGGLLLGVLRIRKYQPSE